MSGILAQPLEDLGADAKAVAGAWFGMMVPGEGTLCFGMKAQRPSARAQAALDEIVAAGVAVRSDGEDGSVSYVPAVDCSPLLGWLQGKLGEPGVSFPLTEKVLKGAAGGFSMSVKGTRAAVDAAEMAARLVEGERRKREEENGDA